jgi:hypothetical protein
MSMNADFEKFIELHEAFISERGIWEERAKAGYRKIVNKLQHDIYKLYQSVGLTENDIDWFNSLRWIYCGNYIEFDDELYIEIWESGCREGEFIYEKLKTMPANPFIDVNASDRLIENVLAEEQKKIERKVSEKARKIAALEAELKKLKGE